MPAVNAFSVDVAAALPGSPRLQARRAAAAEAFAGAALPSTDEEVWRYSRVGDVDLDRYRLAGRPAPGVPAEVQGLVELASTFASVVVVTVDGLVADVRRVRGDDRLAVAEAADADVDLLDALGEPNDAFGLLADAFASPLVVRVPAGAVVEPVVVLHWVTGGGIAAFPRVVVDAGVDSQVSVVEVQRSGPGDALVVGGSDVVVGKAARVGHLVVQDLEQTAWEIATQRSAVDADATLTATAAAFGGAYARLRTDCRLVGRGATGNLQAVWFGEADQHLDFRTFQDHAAPDTTSELVYKGAVGGRSRSVYTGLIKVRPVARGTNAIQTNRNLKLSDDAWAESVPNLEIENNDVRCAHASAVGPVDEEQRWYLESRGVPTAIAERLIVAGFFDEVIDGMPVPAAAGPLRQLVNGKLDRTARA